MKLEKLFNLVLLELSADKLKTEDEMERVLISNEDIASKSRKIKLLLTQLINIDESIIKFKSMISDNNNDVK